ncbi:MAG: hypothetical protein P8Y45_08865 [Exilibacterium sp.]
MNEIFERFAKNCPIPVALRATLEKLFAPEKLDDWFKLNADKQYTKELLFSTIFDLMSLVVFKVFPSVNAAYQSKTETIATSISSVYNKLNGLEPAVAAKLVNDTGRELTSLVEGLKVGCPKTPFLSRIFFPVFGPSILARNACKLWASSCIERSKSWENKFCTIWTSYVKPVH